MRMSDWSSDVCSSDRVIAEAVATLERELGQAAAADRIVLGIFRTQLLITETAHRSAAARIEAPRRSEISSVDAIDRAEAGPAGDHQILAHRIIGAAFDRSEEHTSELQSLMRISYAVFCLKKKTKT